MGHHLDGKNTIVPLIDRLNKYPIGLVDNDKLRQILALLFSEEEAFVASRFPLHEATLAELVKRTGYAAEPFAALLDRMADKGLVIDMPHRGDVYYLLLPGLIGFFEFTFMKQRADLPVAELAQTDGGIPLRGPGKRSGARILRQQDAADPLPRL